MSGIGTNYSQFYKGSQHIKRYGSGNGQKDTVVRYQFNTTDEKGNKIMDKMSKEETMRAVNEISSMYGDNVIVEFSGDGMAKLADHKLMMDFPEDHREIPEDMIIQLDGPGQLSEEALEEIRNSRNHGKSGDEILADMKQISPDAYREYERLKSEREKNGTNGPVPEDAKFLMKWALKREFPDLNVPGMNDWIIDDTYKDVTQTLSEKYANTDVFIGNLDDTEQNIFSDNKEFSIFLSKEKAEILKSGSEEDKEKLLKLLDDSMKSLSELKEKLAKDNDENTFKFGINIGKDNKISFLANRTDNNYSAKNIDELLKKITDQ